MCILRAEASLVSPHGRCLIFVLIRLESSRPRGALLIQRLQHLGGVALRA